MSPQTRLGGLKILKEVVWISLIESGRDKGFPAEFFRLMAKEKINLPFLTCENHDRTWGLNIVIDSKDALKASSLLEEKFGKICHLTVRSVILSLFPIKSNPEITGVLLNVLGKAGIEPATLAHSNSAISVVLPEDAVSKTASALFGALRFSAYRTPADWRLSQEGKEGLYKEVVASYQEKKPGIYCLEWQEGQVLLQVNFNSHDLNLMGLAFKNLARLGLALTFLVSSPPLTGGRKVLFFGLPGTHECNYPDMLQELLPEALTVQISPVAVFSMNGPHFADRYGIASELLMAFDRAQVELLALSCSVASITGVISAHQIHSATQAIQGCFEVPSVIRKTCTAAPK